MKYSKEIINEMLVECGKNHIIALSEVDRVKDKVQFHCLIHDCDYKQTLDDAVHKKYGCPECGKEGKKNTLLNKHNLYKDRPDVADLLLEKDQARFIYVYSKNKVWFVCPKCGSKLYKSVFNVVQNGLKCDKCSDGFYYPNKLMFNILESLEIDFEPEYSPEWISPKRYDFFFQINEKKYIVEMDGGLGHGKKSYGGQEDPSISKENDNYKDQQAGFHNHIVIRINSDKSELEYIKSNIENSLLNTILDLSIVDWSECDKIAQSSILIELCNEFRQHNYSNKELCEMFSLNKTTVSKYLKIGYKLGIIDKYEPHHIGKSVLCLESQIIFKSVSEASEYYGIDNSLISKVCLGKRRTTGGLHFKYIDDCNDIDVNKLAPNYNIKAIIEKSKSIPVIVYDVIDDNEYAFTSICKAAKFLEENDSTIGEMLNSSKLYKNRYILKKVPEDYVDIKYEE